MLSVQAMVLFVGARNFKAELSSTFSQLCCDPHHLVRRSAAAGFHEVRHSQQIELLIQPIYLLSIVIAPLNQSTFLLSIVIDCDQHHLNMWSPAAGFHEVRRNLLSR